MKRRANPDGIQNQQTRWNKTPSEGISLCSSGAPCRLRYHLDVSLAQGLVKDTAGRITMIKLKHEFIKIVPAGTQ